MTLSTSKAEIAWGCQVLGAVAAERVQPHQPRGPGAGPFPPATGAGMDSATAQPGCQPRRLSWWHLEK